MSDSAQEKRAQYVATVTTSQAYHDERGIDDAARPTLSELAATLGVVLTAERLVDAVAEDAEPIVDTLSPGELLDPGTLLQDDD